MNVKQLKMDEEGKDKLETKYMAKITENKDENEEQTVIIGQKEQ